MEKTKEIFSYIAKIFTNFPRSCLTAFVFNFANYFYWLVVPLLMNDLGGSALELSLLQCLGFAIYAILTPFCGKIGDRLNPYIILRVAWMFFVGAVAIILFFPGSMKALYISVCIWPFCAAFFWPVSTGTVGLESPLGKENRNTSLYQVSWSIGKAFGFLFGGMLKTALGINSLYICIILIGVCMIIYPYSHPKWVREKLKENDMDQGVAGKGKNDEIHIDVDIVNTVDDEHKTEKKKVKKVKKSKGKKNMQEDIKSELIAQNKKRSTYRGFSLNKEQEEMTDALEQSEYTENQTEENEEETQFSSEEQTTFDETQDIADIDLPQDLVDQLSSQAGMSSSVFTKKQKKIEFKMSAEEMLNKTYILVGYAMQCGIYGTSSVLSNMYVKLAEDMDLIMPAGSDVTIDTYIGLVFFCYFLAQTIVMGLMSLTMIWAYKRSVMLIFQVLYMLFLFSLAYSKYALVNWVFGFIGGLAGGFAYQTSTFYSMMASESSKSLFMGISECVSGIANSFLPLISGLLCTSFSNNYIQIYISIVFMVVCLIVEQVLYHVMAWNTKKQQKERVDPETHIIEFNGDENESTRNYNDNAVGDAVILV